MSEGLKPCPFCGGEAVHADLYVGCADSGCLMHHVAVRADVWQDRPADRALELACKTVAEMSGECPHSMLLVAPRDCESECAADMDYAECWRMHFERRAEVAG